MERGAGLGRPGPHAELMAQLILDEPPAGRPKRRSPIPTLRRGRDASSQPARAERAVLGEVNDLLVRLDAAVGRLELPLDRRSALDAVQQRVNHELSPTATCLLERAEGERWSTQLATGCTLAPQVSTDALPTQLRRALERRHGVVAADLSLDGPGLAPSSGSGVYVPLIAGDEVVGLLAVEHAVADRYGPDELALLIDQADAIALLLDDVRRFARLRAVSADAGDARLSRELHDRLGQWLTFVSFELEGVIREKAEPTPELTRLYATVQSAIEDLRGTLRQALTGVGPERPLAKVARELCERFEERTEIAVTFTTTGGAERLPVAVEVELGRILQEALTNCERHSRATHVEVSWLVHDGTGTLTVHDDGVGFEPGRGVRDQAAGLIDMRDRAESVGAHLRIDTTPGGGTTVVVASPTSKERTC